MGFFDQEDEEEDDQQKQHTLLASLDDEPLLIRKTEDAEEEEDPLDAYMNSLQAPASTAAPNNGGETIVTKDDIPQPAGENDLEDEDETWYASGRNGKNDTLGSTNNNVSDDHEVEDDDLHTALSSTFRKAMNGPASSSNEQQLATGLRDLPPRPPDAPPIQKEILLLDDTSLGRQWRRETSVTLSSLHKQQQHCWTIDPLLDFSQLAPVLPPAAIAQLHADYTSPTTVQSQTIAVALAGRDALVTAATGQGKTLAYLVSALCHLARQTTVSRDPHILLLVPTRELALQVEANAQSLLQVCDSNWTLRSIVGGQQGKWKLVQDLKRSRTGTQLVVATPGRLLDVVATKGGLSLATVSFVVLDEADKMIQMGFTVQVRTILQQIRSDRQTLMLSATMGRSVEQRMVLPWLSPSTAVRIAVGRTGAASRHVQQHVMVLPSDDAKVTFLLEMLPVWQGLGRTLIFCSTRAGCETLAQAIRDNNSATNTVLTLHADKHQSDRNRAVASFRKGTVVTVLVATDLAGRGLDIPQVQTVVSFDPAKHLDAHVHRVGRAGRLSTSTSTEQQGGSAYTLLTPSQRTFARVLRNAFEREGRVVTPELAALAGSEQQQQRGGDKSGLGYYTNGAHGGASSSGSQPPPPAKRSRWG